MPDNTLADLVGALGVELIGADEADMLGDASAAPSLKLAGKGQNKGAFTRVQTQVEKIVREGYSAGQILTQVSFAVETCVQPYKRPC